MFKLNKLKDVKSEKITIDYVNQEHYDIDKGKVDSFKTLSFDISGNINKDIYSFSFELNCRPSDLLNIKLSESIDFKKYIQIGEILFTINGVTYIDPEINITITRYLKNKFIIYIDFLTDDYYSGVIEFVFNLDDYL